MPGPWPRACRITHLIFSFPLFLLFLSNRRFHFDLGYPERVSWGEADHPYYAIVNSPGASQKPTQNRYGFRCHFYSIWMPQNDPKMLLKSLKKATRNTSGFQYYFSCIFQLITYPRTLDFDDPTMVFEGFSISD